MAGPNFHERFDRGEALTGASPRSFGILMATILGVLTVWMSIARAEAVWWLIAPAGVLAAVLAALALFRASALTPLFVAWMWLGRALHAVMSPLIMGLLYYGFLTPFGLARRLFVHDPLGLKADPARDSYLVAHDAGSGDMTKQY